MNRAICAVCLGLFFALLSAPQSQAWGCKGHQTVAFLAERHMTAEALQLAHDLLSANPIDPSLKRWCGNSLTDLMADASSWPDDIRGQAHNGSWHYIDIPRGAARGPLDAYCGPQGCIISALHKQIAILKDKKAPSALRASALRYIIHFVGDLHQPMHAIDNDDMGGNCVPLKYLRRRPRERNGHFSPNLHAIWDIAILERDSEGAEAAEYAEALDAEFASDEGAWEKAGIHIEDWAWESHDHAEAVAYGALFPKVAIEPPVPVQSCSDDNNIGERLLHEHIFAGKNYQQQAEQVVEERLAQAGARLAMILNDAAKSAQ
jgi:hypothetical protein